MVTTQTERNADLPTPEERPRADVVIYDGNCRICMRQVARLAWWDCQARLAYLSLHDPEVARRYPDLSHEMLMRDMYVVDQGGRRHRGAEAFRYLSRRLRRLWWLAPVLHIPFSMPSKTGELTLKRTVANACFTAAGASPIMNRAAIASDPHHLDPFA